MKICAVLPISNQEDRIQPLFRQLENGILKKLDGMFIINENSSDNSKHVFESESHLIKCPYHLFNEDKTTNRVASFKKSILYAHEKNYDYIAVFHEGWEDNIQEISNIIKSKEYGDYDLVISCRHVLELSLGTIINIALNILGSVFTRTLLRENKGDSINIVKVSEAYKHLDQLALNNNLYSFQLQLRVLKSGGRILYTDVDNGLNYKSYVKLNLARFIGASIMLLRECSFSKQK